MDVQGRMYLGYEKRFSEYNICFGESDRRNGKAALFAVPFCGSFENICSVDVKIQFTFNISLTYPKYLKNIIFV